MHSTTLDMTRILLIEPYPFLTSQYCEKEGYAIYADKAIAYWSGTERQVLDISYPDPISIDMDIEKIKAKISWTMPLWLRWMGQADRYEDYRQSSVLFVARFAQVLRDLQVNSVLFPTGVAHHIEYSLIEIACQIADAQQIFFYPVPFFTGPSRLLPLAQNDTIRDRHILRAEVSRKAAHDEIVAYKHNHLAAKPPQLNEKVDYVATSYPHAMMRVSILGIKAIAKAILRRRADVARHPIDDQRDYDCLSILRLIRNQKTALNYYLSQMLDEAAVDHMVKAEGPLPILYAHYQPESSTFPEGGDYVSHLDVIIAIRRLGYLGKILYKEHPGSWIYYSRIVGFSRVGLCRSVEYYRQLAALGCVFVPPSYKLDDTRIQQLFPITIAGSIGVERSLIGLATCCAGLPWYKGAPGVLDLASTFGLDGVFFDRERWHFDPLLALEWFDQALSKNTIINYPGIGTGIKSGSDHEKVDFLREFDALTRQLSNKWATP
jgi:hypothetical protein